MAGHIQQGKKFYGYDASFDETTNKWYSEAWNRKGKTIKLTKPIYSNHQEAIQAIKLWINQQLDRSL